MLNRRLHLRVHPPYQSQFLSAAEMLQSFSSLFYPRSIPRHRTDGIVVNESPRSVSRPSLNVSIFPPVCLFASSSIFPQISNTLLQLYGRSFDSIYDLKKTSRSKEEVVFLMAF